MVGIIDRGPRPELDDRLAEVLGAAFAPHPQARRATWRAPDVLVVTARHEFEDRETAAERVLPAAAGEAACALVLGDLVEPPTIDSRFVATLCDEIASGSSATLRALNGAFAGFAWDRARGRASFFRDLPGMRGLYVAERGARLVFATDLRLIESAGVERVLDEQAALEFLHYLYVPAPRTVIDGCSAVLAGHVLQLGGASRHWRFAPSRWKPAKPLADAALVDAEIERQLPVFEAKLLDAVRDCLPPRGRVALTLSGGKDSSTLAVALARLCPERVIALTVGMVDARNDETHDAALVCKALGIEHRCYVPDDAQLARGLPDFVAAQDQPVGDPAALPYYLAMRTLPEDCAVILDGTGADYYFGIANEAKIWRHRKRLQVEGALPKPAWKLLLGVMSLIPGGMRQLQLAWSKPAQEAFVAWEGWSAAELERLAGRPVSFEHTYLWQVVNGIDPQRIVDLHTEVVANVWEPHTAFRKAVHFGQMTGRLVRFPLGDARLAEFVSSLPAEMKFRNGVGKQIMREFMKRTLPREIVEKPKSGFIFDLNRALDCPTWPWTDEEARAGGLRFLESWRAAPIEGLRARHRRESADPRWQQRLYALLLLNAVCRGGTRSGTAIRAA
jgi:asparagine synthase (glutamine-hydrolysing)